MPKYDPTIRGLYADIDRRCDGNIPNLIDSPIIIFGSKSHEDNTKFEESFEILSEEYALES